MDEIKNIISQVIESISSKKPAIRGRIEKIWTDIITQQELKHTQLIGVKNGQILINVDSPAWLYQMKLKKINILNRIKKEDPSIKNISFKIGKVK